MKCASTQRDMDGHRVSLHERIAESDMVKLKKSAKKKEMLLQSSTWALKQFTFDPKTLKNHKLNFCVFISPILCKTSFFRSTVRVLVWHSERKPGVELRLTFAPKGDKRTPHLPTPKAHLHLGVPELCAVLRPSSDCLCEDWEQTGLCLWTSCSLVYWSG